jgi:hypothetical protein
MVPISSILLASIFSSGWRSFSPDKEDLTCALVWIHLYSLPQDFWDEETLEGIGNTLDSFVKIS